MARRVFALVLTLSMALSVFAPHLAAHEAAPDLQRAVHAVQDAGDRDQGAATDDHAGPVCHGVAGCAAAVLPRPGIGHARIARSVARSRPVDRIWTDRTPAPGARPPSA
ncbi:MAG: hypothetical protein ACJAVR_001135 [Paracoccaceae bacterium]